jgi:hypothetical protein
MMPSTEAATKGRTLEQLFHVSRDSLKVRVDSADVLSSIREDQHQFSSWMGKTHWSGLSDAIATHLCGYLKDSTVDIFAEAWCKFAELRKEARKTVHDENATTNVALADHDFSYEINPCLDIELNGKKVGEIHFTISAHFDVSGLELGLRQGCVNDVRTGKCEFSGTLEMADKELWRSPSATFELPGEFHFAKPIRIFTE